MRGRLTNIEEKVLGAARLGIVEYKNTFPPGWGWYIGDDCVTKAVVVIREHYATGQRYSAGVVLLEILEEKHFK